MGLLFVYRNNIRFLLLKNIDIYLVLDTQKTKYNSVLYKALGYTYIESSFCISRAVHLDYFGQ